MFKQLKKELFLIAFGIVLFVILMNFSLVLNVAGRILNIFMPVIAGFIIAFILNVPMSGVERLTIRITRGKVTKLQSNVRRLIYLLLTLIIVAGVIAVIVIMVIPDLANSAKSLYHIVENKWPDIMAMLVSYNVDVEWITGTLESLDIEQFITSTVDFASSAVSSVVEFGIGLIIAMYALMSKEELARQANKLLKAFLKDVMAAKVRNIAILINRTFSRFISGQCLEACILGILIFIVLNIGGVPYADLVGVLTIVCAFVPYIGAFISFTAGVMLVVIVAPHKIILYAILYLAVQFVEGHFIYPYVVGNSVGMKPLWTLIAVIIGGKLLGLFGMIFFIPLTAVVVTLFKDYMERKLNRKEHFHPDENLRGDKDDIDSMS